MYSTKWVIAGIIVFLIAMTLPVWYNAAMGEQITPPKLVLPKNKKHCVESESYMIADHMELLVKWREMNVRKGEGFYISKTYDVPYKTQLVQCFQCHKSYNDFCGKCHNFVGVRPYCFECHSTPDLVKQKGEVNVTKLIQQFHQMYPKVNSTS